MTLPPSPAPAPSLAVRLRRFHAALAPVVLAPLVVTAATGVAYRLLRDWGGLDRDHAHLLMVIHEGEWLGRLLGRDAETIYVLLNGAGLSWMLLTGAAMLGQRWRRACQRRVGGGDT
jgi:hypothetical protein